MRGLKPIKNYQQQALKRLQKITHPKQLHFLINHKFILLGVICLSLFISASLYLRSLLIANLTKPTPPSTNQIELNSSVLGTSTDASQSATPSPSDLPEPTDNAASTLGTSTFTAVPPAVLTPPVPIYTPIPTPTSAPISNQPVNTAPSCSGTPTADNSQVYISPSSTLINNTSTIKVDLQDCANQYVSNDNLTITLTSGDSTTTINGQSASSPYHAKAVNGNYSFTVTSSNPTTAVFNIQDTSQNFQVTMPGYKQPSVTFTSTASTGNSNCSGGAGVPNWYYSDVYGTPTSVTVGADVILSVTIRDCFKNTAPVSDTLTISLNNSDPTARVNNQTPPISITTNQGQASFTVTSRTAGTDTFTVTDTSQNFKVTDTGNQNPAITFTSSNPTPTPSPTSTPTPTPSSQPTPTPTPSPTPKPS